MPHQFRHRRKRKKPRRTQAMGIEDNASLILHRELALLRIAGGAKPGKHRDKLMKERFDKLDEALRRKERDEEDSV